MLYFRCTALALTVLSMSVMSKYDCSLHVVMVVLKAFDVDTRPTVTEGLEG